MFVGQGNFVMKKAHPEKVKSDPDPSAMIYQDFL
jgi:hypothetical protein